MKEPGPKSRPDGAAEHGPLSAAAEVPSARTKILVAIAGASFALVFVLWVLGRDSSGGDFAVAGVRAAAAHVDAAALAPPAEVDADAPPLDEDAIDAGEADDPGEDGDAFADWLAEAQARAKLAAASPAGSASSAPATGSASAGAARDAGAAEPPLGHATRLRNIGLQLIAICASGRAAEVQPLALEVLQERPAPWLAKRIRAVCLHETEPPPPPPADDSAEP